jgi:phosphoribosylformylglycinamidine cyclo-ligase
LLSHSNYVTVPLELGYSSSLDTAQCVIEPQQIEPIILKPLTYGGAGVDYSALDPFKIAAQTAALQTARNLGERFGMGVCEVTGSRGESVYLIEFPDRFLGLVEEGLGTKNLVADAMTAITGKLYYHKLAQCTVAMIVNDMITLGALPMSVAMHLAVENSNWFDDKERAKDLVEGWKAACDLARCTWGGGETPALRGIIQPGASLLSGSSMGMIYPKTRLIKGNITAGDRIVIIESSGIHANGLTLARKIADKVGYDAKLSDGRLYGEALLDPTHIYVGFIEDCLVAGVDIHYGVNVTGHGFRKLMRHTRPFTYVVKTLPTQLPVFDFIQENGPVTVEEMYGNLNMGAGFAVYVPEVDVDRVIAIASALRLRAFDAGYIEEGDKKVVIEPKGIEFLGTTLAVR